MEMGFDHLSCLLPDACASYNGPVYTGLELATWNFTLLFVYQVKVQGSPKMKNEILNINLLTHIGS